MGISESLKFVYEGVTSQWEAANARVEAGLKQTGTAAEESAPKLGGLGSKLDSLGISSGVASAAIAGGVATAGLAIGKFALDGVTKFGDLGMEVKHFEGVAGTTADESSRWIAVMGQYGISAEDAAKPLGMLAKNIGTGKANLSEFGVQIAKTSTGTVDLQKTMLNISDAFAHTDDETTRAALGTKAFGKQWQTLIPLLEGGSQGLSDAFANVNDNMILDQGQTDQAVQYHLAMEQVKQSVEGLQIALGSGLAPAMTNIADAMTKLNNAGIGKGLGEFAKFAAETSVLSAAATTVNAIGDLFSSGGKKAAASADQMRQAFEAMRAGDRDAASAESGLAQVQKDHLSVIASEDAGYLRLAQGVDNYIKGLQAAQTAVLAQANDQVALDNANKTATDGYHAMFNAIKTASDAHWKNVDATNAAKLAADQETANLVALAGAQVKVREGAQEAAGATVSWQQKIGDQISALQGLQNQFPALRGAIQTYINELLAIPKNISTTITTNHITYDTNSPAGPLTIKGAHAVGGTAMPGETFLAGEGGRPELVTAGATGAHVFTGAQTSDMLGGRSGGGPPMVVHVSTTATAQQVLDAINNAWRNGARYPWMN